MCIAKDKGGQCDAWFAARGNTTISPNASRMSNANPLTADGRKSPEYRVYQYARATLVTRVRELLLFRSSSAPQVDFPTFAYSPCPSKFKLRIIHIVYVGNSNPSGKKVCDNVSSKCLSRVRVSYI